MFLSHVLLYVQLTLYLEYIRKELPINFIRNLALNLNIIYILFLLWGKLKRTSLFRKKHSDSWAKFWAESLFTFQVLFLDQKLSSDSRVLFISNVWFRIRLLSKEEWKSYYLSIHWYILWWSRCRLIYPLYLTIVIFYSLPNCK